MQNLGLLTPVNQKIDDKLLNGDFKFIQMILDESVQMKT